MKPAAAPRLSIASLALCVLLPSLGTSIANVGLPTLSGAFNASFHQVQWVVLAYLLAITALVAGAGRLGDLAGRRRLLLGGLAVFTLASFLCDVAPSLPLLVAARALQGTGAALMMTLAMALLLAYRYLPADRPAALPASPSAPRALLRNPVLGAGLAMNALVATVVMATLVVGPFYLSGALALGTASVGLVMSCGPLVSALAGVPAGRCVDRFGALPSTIAGLLAMALGCALLPMAAAQGGVAGYIGALVVVTAGYALFQAANNTAVMAGSQPDRRGQLSGLLNLSRNLGLMAGTSVMGALFAWGGMGVTFGAATTLLAVALAIAVVFQPHFNR